MQTTGGPSPSSQTFVVAPGAASRRPRRDRHPVGRDGGGDHEQGWRTQLVLVVAVAAASGDGADDADREPAHDEPLSDHGSTLTEGLWNPPMPRPPPIRRVQGIQMKG